MNKLFYPRLAAQNLKKNKAIYLPYLLASALIIALFYILDSISIMVGESDMRGGGMMMSILMMSSGLCGILAMLILFYINSFIMKRRKREFGLYSILGMEKRHISLVMLWEVVLTGLLSLIAGIGGGALLSQLLFLILLKMVHLPATLVFQVPMQSVVNTALLFAVGFGIVLIFDVVSICRLSPIALLHGANEGEREPKARWLLGLIGFAALGGGYTLALCVQKPSDALSFFFLAVLLVIIGTYALFVAGSIVVLKLLRKNKRFYYKPRNFISVSGMIYRMKQNAAGLASICILSTAVLVTMSSTVCLFIGEEAILAGRHLRQVTVSCIGSETDTTDEVRLAEEKMRQTAEAYAAGEGFAVENYLSCLYLSGSAFWDGNQVSARSESGEYLSMQVMPLEDFNRLKGEDYSLSEGKVLINGGGTEQLLSLSGLNYRVVGQLQDSQLTGISTASVFLVVPQTADLDRIMAAFNEDSPGDEKTWGSLICRTMYDANGDSEALEGYYSGMRDAYNAQIEHISMVDNIDAARSDFYQIYGSLFFVGIFFTILFIAATVLIIYYKQITEGYDDHDRFQIMSNVGMSDREIRATISKQVLMVFFLPLGMAVLHIVVAFPVLCKLLQLFEMHNQSLFTACVAATVLLFALIYGAVYQMTARTYYRIVQAKEI